MPKEAKGLHLQGIQDLVDATMNFLDQVPKEDVVCSEIVALAIKAAIDIYIKLQEEVDYPVINCKNAPNLATPRIDT